MKIVKKFSIIILCAFILSMLFATTAFAGVYSQDYVTVYLGDSVTVAISSDDSTGTYDVTGYSGSVSACNSGDGWLEPGENGYVTIFGNSLGSGTVEVSYLVADSSYVDYEGAIYINVEVIEPSVNDNSYEDEAKSTPTDEKFDVTIGEKKYTLNDQLKDVTLPAGFKIADGTYGTQKVKVAKYVSKEGQEIVLYALTPKDGGKTVFKIFNSSKADFHEPMSLTQEDNVYFILNIPKDLKLPETFGTKDITVGSISSKAIYEKANEKSGIVYVYALGNGEEGYYSYDTKEGTIQRCPDFQKVLNGETIEEKEPAMFSKTSIIIFISAGIVIFGLVLTLIIVLVKHKKDSKLDNY